MPHSFNYGALRLRTSIRRLYHPWHFMLWCVHTGWRLKETLLVVKIKRAIPNCILLIEKTGPPITTVGIFFAYE